MTKKFVHQPANCLIGIPQYANKRDLQFPTFKDCLSLTESEVQMMIDQAHREYLTTLSTNTENRHEVVMLDMYDSLMISLKVYNRWWQSVKDTDKDV